MPPRRSTRSGSGREDKGSMDPMEAIRGTLEALVTSLTTRQKGGSSSTGNFERGESFE